MIRENNSEPMLVLPKSRMGKDRFFFIIGILFTVISIAVLAAGLWWFFTVRWGARTWSNLQLQELIYTLMSPLEGTNSDMVRDHIISCVVPAAIIAAAAAVLLIILYRRKTILHILQIAAIMTGGAFAVFGFASAWEVLDLSGYMESQEEYSTFMDENYIDPVNVSLEFPEKKRNLVYIFLESMENTFADEASGGAFSKNVIPELTQISLENQNFSGNSGKLNGAHTMTGATWTVGAMFSQTSGLPLLIPISNNSMSLQEDFFSSVRTLGNILEDEGYRQTILMGSDATFGGRRNLFTQHGNFDIHDYYYYIDQGVIPSDYFVWWGFEDEILFEQAKKELAEIGSSDEPFNFMLLTVDTHFEDGWVCNICRDDFDDQYSNVYACSSRQVADFVEWIKKQPFYENTTVILTGDHLTMDKDYCDEVSSNYDRTVYYSILNSPIEPVNNQERQYTTFDYFPTTLAALGVTIPGNRLGLGTNLFSGEQTIYEKYGAALFDQGLNSRSEVMENLTAGIRTDYAVLEVEKYDPESQTVEIRAKDVELPDNTTTLVCHVWPEGRDTETREYNAEKISESEYRVIVPITDFFYTEGRFHVSLYSQGLARNAFLTSTTMVIEDPENDSGVTMGNAKPTLEVSDFNYETGKITIRFDNIPTNVVALNLAVWSADDQSDLKWHSFTENENGEYVMELGVADLGALGVGYNFHLYGINVNGDTDMMDMEYKTIG